MGHNRRRILWLGVTAHPTAEWLANQLTQVFSWECPLNYLVRDRDAYYGDLFVRGVRSLGIRDHPTSPRSPWQNGYAERLIGSIRRECLDHVVVFGERHLRHLLLSYVNYKGFGRLDRGCRLHASPHRFGLGAGRGGWVCALKFVVIDRRDEPLALGTDELSKRTTFELHDDGFVCFVHRVTAVHRDNALRDDLVVQQRADDMIE
jgi:transposase InsO family protein